MTRTYRIERWIAAVLLTLFILPFIAEAESFYSRFVSNRTPVQTSGAAAAQPQSPTTTLPEDSLENAIDLDFDEAELDGDSCC